MSYLNKNGRITVTVAPATEPVSTADAKAWLRIPSAVTSDDTLIDALVVSARLAVEEFTGLYLITQTVTQSLDFWPGSDGDLPEVGHLATVLRAGENWIELLASPVVSITDITTYDDADVGTAWTSTNYRLSNSGDRPRIVPVGSAAWPTATRRSDAIVITYVVGFGAASAIPSSIVTAIKLLVAHWYENRGDGDPVQMPAMVKTILQPHRRMKL